jgi:hypothetical protein
MLSEIVSNVVAAFPSLDFKEELAAASFPAHIIHNFNESPYYKCFAAYVKLYNIKRVLELGTCTGISSMALAKYADVVDTYDIKDDCIDPSVLKNPKINFSLLKTPESVLDISYSGYDLVFVDIDHSGKMEPFIHEKLKREHYGLVFYDDVMMDSMKSFWDSIENNKVIAFWNKYGTGIVNYEKSS